MTRARSRGIQRMVLEHYKGTTSSANKLVCLSGWAREDTIWWLNLDIKDCHMSLRSIPIWETSRMATDAMDTAIGSVFEGRIMYEVLDRDTARRKISHKDWIAFERTIRPLLSTLVDRVICWHVDNMNMRQAWLNSGSVKDVWLSREVVEMQILLNNQNTKVVPVYVRSAQHLHADLISRNRVMPDWHLSRTITQKLFQRLGHPEVDLTSTSNSTQTNLYFSALVDSRAASIDAFTENWNQFTLAYIFPPLEMMELILNRIFQCSVFSRFIVISLWKPKSQWFPKILKRSVQLPIRLPVSWETVVDMAESGQVPTTP